MALYDYLCPVDGERHEDVFHLIAECDTHVERCADGHVMERRTRFASVTTMGPLLMRSNNPNIERFLETGDPAGLKRSDPLHIA